MYSRNNFKQAIQDGHLEIYPYEETKLTGIGYNLSSTNFAFSISKGILLTIHKQVSSNEDYVIIPPNDTVLFFSKEYIAVDHTLSGTFHSKVSSVSQGLGHISTTLDPTWKGQLLISVNNPTNKKITFHLEQKSGNILTMLLYELNQPVSGSNIHDNNQGRCDLLLKHFSKVNIGTKYRKKHLELKAFIVDKFANSLNGYDEFIQNFEKIDKYSKKVNELLELRTRLNNHQVLFTENRYTLGNSGEYKIFVNSNEYTLLKECAIFKLMDMNENLLTQTFTNLQTEKNIILENLGKCIHVINYEIKTIDHLRRITWQKEEITKFANENSELVKLQKRRLWFFAFIKVMALVIISGFFCFVGYKWVFLHEAFTQILPLFAALCGAWATFVLNSFFKIYKTYKENL